MSQLSYRQLFTHPHQVYTRRLWGKMLLKEERNGGFQGGGVRLSESVVSPVSMYIENFVLGHVQKCHCKIVKGS